MSLLPIYIFACHLLSVPSSIPLDFRVQMSNLPAKVVMSDQSVYTINFADPIGHAFVFVKDGNPAYLFKYNPSGNSEVVSLGFSGDHILFNKVKQLLLLLTKKYHQKSTARMEA